ncbi:MAG: hypothetical protein DHS20C18_13570 [Saprospiraceae bacterium]|nr:MAG: hypothetical protein DHS20C18_13570 [Saprospiraceae bacterium]
MEKKQYKLSVNGKFEFDDKTLPKIDSLEVKDGHFHILLDQQAYRAEIVETIPQEKIFVIRVNGNIYRTQLADQYDQLVKSLGLTANVTHKVKEVKAPMPGLVLEILIKPGQEVVEGEALFILEAMKMENILKSPGEGTISKITVEKGMAVDKGEVLVFLD